MVFYRILISITITVVLYWIWNYLTNFYAAVFVSTGLILVVADYIFKAADELALQESLRHLKRLKERHNSKQFRELEKHLQPWC